MKKLLLVILTMFLALSFVGCETDNLLEYKKASEKTQSIERGQTSGEISLVMDFNTEGMTADEIKELNYYKDMEINFNSIYDYKDKKSIYKTYMNAGGLGIDYEFFINGDRVFMKLPIVGKYLNFKDMESIANIEANSEIEEDIIISPETKKALSSKRVSLMKKEDVFKGKDIVLTTPDGEVKTTEYTIKLTDEQIKELFVFAVDTVANDTKLKNFYEKYIQGSSDFLKNKSYEDFQKELKENIYDYNVESFNYTAYVDIDGYIVDEVIDIVLKVINPGEKNLSQINYQMNIKNWDINKEQKFEFPELTEENTINVNEIDESMPGVIENMFDGI